MSWITHDVTTGETSENENGEVFVECRYPKLGFIAVFAVNSSILPPQTSTSQPPAVTTHVTPEKQVHIQFKLVANFEEVISSEEKEAAFIVEITQSIADAMAVDKSRIANVSVHPGSILVSFTLLPGGPGENNVSTAMSTLKDLVTSGNFSVTLGDGQTLVADSASFLTSSTEWTFTVSTPQPIQPTTSHHEEEQTETSTDLNTSTLVGIIVGSVVGVVLLIVCVILFFRMRSKQNKAIDNVSSSHKILTLSPRNSFQGNCILHHCLIFRLLLY